MLAIGLTGGIGAGKSSVSRRLAARGAVIVDADVIARQVVEPGQPALAAIVERFGPEVLTDDGNLDRPKVAGLVFGDPQALADLNAITWPAVGAEIARRLSDEAESDHVVILDIPLLVESGRDNVAGLIVVDCPEEVALQRLVAERGMDPDDVRRRMAAQASREERLARADLVIDNSGDEGALDDEVARAWSWIESLSAQSSTGVS
jgi:dephospho-CoA kinase